MMIVKGLLGYRIEKEGKRVLFKIQGLKDGVVALLFSEDITPEEMAEEISNHTVIKGIVLER